MIDMKLESVRIWKSDENEMRVYVNFAGGASATWYVTGNRWNPAKSWSYDRCTRDDVNEARKNPACFDAGRWKNYYANTANTSTNVATPATSASSTRNLSYAQRVDRAVRGYAGDDEDARFDLDVEREFNRRRASSHGGDF